MRTTEKQTDLLVYDFFKKFEDELIIEPQGSKEPRIYKILQASSKKNNGNSGFPEYIIRFKNNPNLIIVIEDKKDFKNHESLNLNRPIKYAVDGAIHYGKKLSKEFDVISIGVSGTFINDLKITHHLHLKNGDQPIKLEYNKFLTPNEYLNFYLTDERKNKQDFENLLIFSNKLNNDLFKIYKIKEDERAILIAAILVALKNQSFLLSYKSTTLSLELCEAITLAVKTELNKLNINKDHIETVLGHFSFICQSPKFKADVNFLKKLILDIDENINCYIKNTKYKDVLGNLYVKFLEKANGDKQLGIVLTPEHIARFMVKLLELNSNSLILDNCSGTGGYLLAASKYESKLLGFEYEPKMFTLMVLNLMVHDISLENIYQGDSLSNESLNIIENLKPNAGILNPPYDGREWEFIMKNMKYLQKNSKCAAIVPITTLTTNNIIRKEILENHTVEAVFSMPDELFFNSKTSVVTCIILFSANTPHPTEKNVYFGFYKNDGFEKRKKFGRYDVNNTWSKFENDWFWDYKNNINKLGYSVSKKITYNDEWCAESFLETDYNSITENDFEEMLKKYAAFKILNS